MEKPKDFTLLKKLKEKPKNQLKYKFFAFAAMAVLLSGIFVVPEKAAADGNVYEFSKVVLTEQVQTGPTENGPWTDSNFIRVGKDKGFYVKVTIKVTSLTNKDNQTVTIFDTKNDAILTPKIWNTNLAISGVSPSFVAKVTEAQARAIGEKIKAGADPKTLPGVPCITSSITTGSMAVVKAAVIVGAATAVVLTGGTAALATGAAINTGALAVGAGAAGAAASNAALAVAIGAGTSAGTAVGAGVGAAAGATFLSVGAQDYIQCLGPVMPAPQSKGQVEVGGIVYEQVVSVPFTAYSGLGMGNDKSQIADSAKDASTQPVNEFFVVPNVNFSAWFGLRNNFMSALGAGKSIYVQLYEKQSDADAHAKDVVPSSVPNNGQNTGSGNDMGSKSNPFIAFFAMVIGTIVAFLQYLTYFVFSWLVLPLMEAILKIHPYTDNFVAIIYPGWLIVRNVCNIFFIIALIIIAMATLFRLESYQYRHLLVQLILAALLINFSLVIAQAVLGVADTVQGQFLPTNSTVARDLGKALMVDQRQWFFSGGTSFADAGFMSNLIIPLFYLAMALGSFMVFVVLTGFLVIRIIALWILLLISPVAYAAGALPTTSHYRSEWWSNFLKYAFFTPIMAFFLNLTALLSQAQQNNPILKQVTSGNAFGGNDSVGQFVVKVGSNVILLIFLLAAIKVAENFGVFGADIMAKAVKGGVFAPFVAAGFGFKRGGGYIGRKYNEWTANTIRGHNLKASWGRSIAYAALNPVAFVKGWQKHTEGLVHAAQAKAEAAGLEVAEQRLTGGKKVIPRVLAHEKQEEDEWAKNYMNMSRELVVQTLRQIAQMGTDDQSMAAKRAIIKVAMAKGYIDDGVQDGTDLDTDEGKALANKMKHNHQFKIRDERDDEEEEVEIVDPNDASKKIKVKRQKWERDWMEKEVDIIDKKTGEVIGKKKKRILKYNDLTRKALYEAMFTGSNGHMDTAAMRLITEEGESEGKSTYHYEYLKDVWFNFNTGQWEWRPNSGAYSGSSFARGEMAKMQSRPQAQSAHHSFMDLSDDGNIDREVFRVFAVAASENPPFMQERTAHQALSGSAEVEFSDRKNEADNFVLKVDEASEKRIKNMMQESPEAVAAMYLRATKLGSTKIDLDNFIKEQGKFQVRVKRKDGTEKLLTIDAKNRRVVDAGSTVETATYADTRHKVKPPPSTP